MIIDVKLVDLDNAHISTSLLFMLTHKDLSVFQISLSKCSIVEPIADKETRSFTFN